MMDVHKTTLIKCEVWFVTRRGRQGGNEVPLDSDTDAVLNNDVDRLGQSSEEK